MARFIVLQSIRLEGDLEKVFGGQNLRNYCAGIRVI